MAMGGEMLSLCHEKETACLRVGSVNVNSLNAFGKMR